MKLSEKVKEVIDSGIQPIVFHFEPVKFFSSPSCIVRTFLIINSLDLGTLTYRQYRFVARRTKQGDRMVERHLHKLLRAMPSLLEENPKVDCFTLPIYARLLRDGVLAKMVMEALALFPEVPPARLCLELSADILYEDMADATQRIAELRALGVKVAICEVGDEYCPVFRLANVAFDYAFLDTYATESLARDVAESVAGSLVGYLHYLNVKVIAPGLTTEELRKTAEACGLDGYTEEPEGGEVTTDE